MPRRPVVSRRVLLAAAAAMAIAFALVAVQTGAGAPARSAPSPLAAPSAAPAAPAPAAPVASAAAAAASVAPPATANEQELMDRLRSEVDSDPRTAIAVADDGERRFPSSRVADERAFLRMRGLVHLGEIGIARDAARQFFERHPDSPLARQVFRLTGMRPLPPLGPPR